MRKHIIVLGCLSLLASPVLLTAPAIAQTSGAGSSSSSGTGSSGSGGAINGIGAGAMGGMGVGNTVRPSGSGSSTTPSEPANQYGAGVPSGTSSPGTNGTSNGSNNSGATYRNHTGSGSAPNYGSGNSGTNSSQ